MMTSSIRAYPCSGLTRRVRGARRNSVPAEACLLWLVLAFYAGACAAPTPVLLRRALFQYDYALAPGSGAPAAAPASAPCVVAVGDTVSVSGTVPLDRSFWTSDGYVSVAVYPGVTGTVRGRPPLRPGRRHHANDD